MNGEAATAPPPDKAGKPQKYRRPMLGPVTECLLLVALVAAAGLALRAWPIVELLGDPLAHVGEFYRRVVLGVLQGRLIPLGYLLAAAAAGLGVLAAWPGVRPEIRGAVAAYAMLLMLGPVLNYGPQVELLSMYPKTCRSSPRRCRRRRRPS